MIMPDYHCHNAMLMSIMMVIFTKVELGVNLQAGSGLKADDDSHHTCYLGGLWGDYNDDD